jgi:tetratricopeptide (TPR) repeat protein
MGVLLFFTVAASSPACIQGYHLPPPRPILPKADFAMVVPPADFKMEMESLKLALPKLEPATLSALPPDSITLGLPAARPPAAPVANVETDEDVFRRFVREFESAGSKKTSLEDRTDYAVALIHLGRYPDAIKVLHALEAERPGVYTTASNLGTAYELVGNLEEALKWIGRGIERNASSHQGSEWLHVAILRAKINLRSDQAWLKQHTVIEPGGERSADEIVRAIEYQLNERLHFVKPSDAVVCDLFYQAALRMTGEAAEPKRAYFLQESLRFGDWRKAEIAALRKA